MSSQTPLHVPDIGDAEQIELVSWNVCEGDQVQEGEELCELVTNKASFPLASPYKGKVAKIEKQSGSLLRVGEVLLFLEKE